MKSNDKNKLSRRRFLEAAVVVTATAQSVKAAAPDPARERLEELVKQYGSEIGDLRKVR